MTHIRRFLLPAALAALIAVPAVSQTRMSDSTEMLKALREGNNSMVGNLLANPSSGAANARDSATGEGPLHILVRRRDLTWLSYLLGHGSRADMQNNDGTTPLHLATMLGWAEGVQQLLARRASVDLANNRGETALILAVQGRQHAIIPILLAQGADPRRADSAAGYSALDYARQDRRDPTILRLLETAPAQNRPSAEVFGPTR